MPIDLKYQRWLDRTGHDPATLTTAQLRRELYLSEDEASELLAQMRRGTRA